MKIILKDLIQDRLDLERSKGRVFDVSKVDVKRDIELYNIHEPFDRVYFEETPEGTTKTVTLSDEAPEEAWEAAMLRYAWYESPYYEPIR